MLAIVLSSTPPPPAPSYEMAPTLDNANPTILDVSELPSHRSHRKPRDRSQKNGIRAMAYARPRMDPFDLSDTSDDSDGSTVEPIDEQEIYGETHNPRSHLVGRRPQEVFSWVTLKLSP